MIQIVLVSFVFFGVLKAATQVFRLVQYVILSTPGYLLREMCVELTDENAMKTDGERRRFFREWKEWSWM